MKEEGRVLIASAKAAAKVWGMQKGGRKGDEERGALFFVIGKRQKSLLSSRETSRWNIVS